MKPDWATFLWMIGIQAIIGLVALVRMKTVVGVLEVEVKALREAIASLSSINMRVAHAEEEIDKLRKWRHDFGQKEGVYDTYDRRLLDLERRKSVD